MAWESAADVERWFTYHAPTADEVEVLREIRQKARELAFTFLALVPPGGDRSAAFRRLREAVMNVNAAIVCRKREEAGPNKSPAEQPAPTLEIRWTGNGAHTWRCPACDAENSGTTTAFPGPFVVACTHCTGSFRVR